MVKHSQSFRNSKFVMSLLFLKKEVEDEVGFLHVDKHIKISFKLISTLLASKFPSGDTIIIDGYDQVFLK